MTAADGCQIGSPGEMRHSLDRRAILAEHWFLRCLSEQELDRLLHTARVERHPKNRLIFARGDPGATMMAVLNGQVKLSIGGDDGREMILHIAGPGDVFGEIALLTGVSRTADATAFQECSLLVIERRAFRPILEANSALCLDILGLVCRRLIIATDRVEDILFHDRSAKLARVLIRLAKTHGKQTPKGTEIRLNLSQRQLGNLVGLTRESMNKQLADWKKRQIVDHAAGFVTIADMSALEKMAGGVV